MRFAVALLAAFVLVGAAAPARAIRPKTPVRPTVAVLYFDYTGKDEELGTLRKGLAQMLISDLAGLDAIRLVERDRLEAVLAELELARQGRTLGKIDPATAAKVGKLLGARFLVLGGYFALKDTLRVDARVVDVETGRVIKSTGASGKLDDFLTVEQTVATALGEILAKQLKVAVAPAPRVPRPARLSARVAILYSRGLGEVDRGELAKAEETLKAVVKLQEDFKLAAVDLDKLMQ